ncbi:class I SAM-dependent methyltransferase [Pseudoalteromonas ruthenica]|uniref:class I SAM-dependent methyltransferase n=1 Tax=Pseudoalteromonas ruthenica TaxID=151081 RepID=UPI0012488F77|nr:class I SAM-dependent methyltransferase [Pseudoalteromonas ruthenica]
MTLKQLQQLVATIIAAPVDAGVVKQPIHALVNALEQESGVSSQADMNTSHGTYTEHGVAISPVQAARCSLEPLRTQVFMQGVAAAINDKVHGDKVVHILYAGTGPFATLLLPYLACHPELPVRVTLLDIHQENIEAVKKLVVRWHIGHLINEYVVADATCWQPDAQSRFDIVISETMTALLRREPQVWIFKNLVRYLQAQGVLIPQVVSLRAWLERAKERVLIDEYFRLDKAAALRLARDDITDIRGELVIPAQHQSDDHFTLTTDIQVYNHCVLSEGQSSLTVPFSVPPQATCLFAGAHVPFHYANPRQADFIFDFPHDKRLAAHTLPSINDSADLGLIYIKRAFAQCLWAKQNQQPRSLSPRDWQGELFLTQALGIPLDIWFAHLFNAPDLASFESRLLQCCPALLCPQQVMEMNRQLLAKLHRQNE